RSNNDWDLSFAAEDELGLAALYRLHETFQRSGRSRPIPDSSFTIGLAEHRTQKVRAIRSVRWASPFLKAFGGTPPAVPTTRHVPDGTRVYCVGDIHGRDDLLQEMAERVEADMKVRSFDHAVTVFLGDYVDRGLGSIHVVERLSHSEWPTQIIALAGN